MRKIDYPNSGGQSRSTENPRVETGAVQFGEDWPGYFIRGDSVMELRMSIKTVVDKLEGTDDPEVFLALGTLKSVAYDMAKCFSK
jgi:hypothetical protein